jgi:hypothetical protein
METPSATLVAVWLVTAIGCAPTNSSTAVSPEFRTAPATPPAVLVETGSVVPADGTRIGYSKYGGGPALVVCHGTHTVAQDWAAFGREMGRRYIVYVYDRRGRGSSPDIGKNYRFDSEIDDLAAKFDAESPSGQRLTLPHFGPMFRVQVWPRGCYSGPESITCFFMR